ncbi:MAG TPA: zinc finger domain-containing protein, partial [Thermoanaerobaculia bacterium]|nr:zinc finger domain-containing protein [Thermoanaerobaculia bacterium]
EASVHLTEIPRLDAPLTAEELAEWKRVLDLRAEVLAVLEGARAAKQIGQSLEADVTLYGDDIPTAGVDLAKLFIVSHVDIRPASADGTKVSWAPARGKKCGRCWTYREEVANDGDLCARCQKVVDELAPAELPTA